MGKKFLAILIPLFLFWGMVGEADATSLTMPLSQVKPGMKGIGKSAFAGNKIEEFDVEILGVLDNVQPKRSIIIANLTGKGLEETGVISGMSGSPIYIDGKLIGAIAYSFAFSKKAIAGITPISEMMAIFEQKEKPKSSFSLEIPFKTSLAADEILGKIGNLLYAKGPFQSGGQSFLPLSIPVFFRGFSLRVFEKVKPLFVRAGFVPVISGSSGQALQTPSPSTFTLQEGDPVAIQLVGGDLDVSALGTVTYVDGNKILAFGHPMYNLGPVDYAMSKVRILAVVPSLENSFKMAATENLIGKFSQDRITGAFGEIGKMPRLIPLNVKVLPKDGELREFKLKVVNDRILTALLINMSVASLLSIEERAYGDLSLELEANIYMDNGMSVRLEDLYSGNLDTSVTTLSGLLTAVVYFLTNNEFMDLGIHRIDLNIRASEEPKFCYLERVWLNKYEVTPGERIAIRIDMRTFRGESLQHEIEIIAPQLPSGSEFQLLIGDAASMHQVEMSLYKTQDFVPRNINQLVRILNSLRKNNRVYFKIIASKAGLFLKGEEMPNLPPTMKSMFSSPRSAASAPTELTRSTLNEYQLPVPFVFKGMVTIPIKIKK